MREDDGGASGRSSVGCQVVAAWVSLQRVGVPVGQWVERKVWDNALRVVSGVESTPALSYRTKTAKDYGVLEVRPGSRGREGLVRLRNLEAEGVFIPLDLPDLAELIKEG